MPPSLISLNLLNTRYVENIKKPLAITIINQPKYSDRNSCVDEKKADDASKFK